MKHTLTAALAVLLSVYLQAQSLGTFKSTQYVEVYLKKPLNADGDFVKPTSADVQFVLETDTATVYYGSSSTWPFNGIYIYHKILNSDTSYIFRAQISNIDGAGCNCMMAGKIRLYGAGQTQARETDVSFQVIGETIATLLPRLDADVTSRLAPAVAGRTLGVGLLGHVALDLDNLVGQIDAVDNSSNAFTSAKFADGFLTGTKIGAGAIGATQAPNLDVAVSSRLAPGGTLATVTNVSQLGGSTAGITGLNGMFDGNENYVSAELNVLGNLGGSVQGTVKLGAGGTESDTSFTNLQTTVAGLATSLSTNLDVPVSSRLAPSTAGRTLLVNASGQTAVDFNNIGGTLDNAEIGNDLITNQKIAAGAITSSEAPNLDATITSRLAPSGTLATVTNVTQLGGSSVGITGLNEGFDADAIFVTPEFNMVLATNGTANDTRITDIISSLATSLTATDSLESWIQMIMYVAGACDGCSTKYLPADGTGYKDGYEVYLGGAKKATITFYHENNPAVLDARKARKD